MCDVGVSVVCVRRGQRQMHLRNALINIFGHLHVVRMQSRDGVINLDVLSGVEIGIGKGFRGWVTCGEC